MPNGWKSFWWVDLLARLLRGLTPVFPEDKGMGPRFLDCVGRENIMPNVQDALDLAQQVREEQDAMAS